MSSPDTSVPEVRPTTAVIGAGISGLALAYRLQQKVPSAELTLLEQAARPGGTCWTKRRDGFQVEIGPNGFLDSKPTTIGLCRDLGLGTRLLPATEAAARNRYLFLDGRLRPLPGGPAAFLRSDLLSWRGGLPSHENSIRRAAPLPAVTSRPAHAGRSPRRWTIRMARRLHDRHCGTKIEE